jgi:RsiW-degrading membrane proteinase PrsW (M82 family)
VIAPRLVETTPAWGQTDALFEPRRSAFWLFAFLVVVGAHVVLGWVVAAFEASPLGAWLALGIWTAYLAVFVLAIAVLDLLEPEPPAFLAAAALWGGLVATWVGDVANTAINTIVAHAVDPAFAVRWHDAIAGPASEEVLKALGVVVVILIAPRQVNTVLDGFVYGAMVGLSFQVVENFHKTMLAMQNTIFVNRDPVGEVWDLFVERGVFGGVFSHAIWSGIVGVGVAYVVVGTRWSRPVRVVLATGALLVAAGFHAVWNAPTFVAHTIDDLFARGAVIGFPALVLLAVLVGFALTRDARWLDTTLQAEEPLVGEHERRRLLRFRTRHGAVWEVWRRSGWRAARRMRRRQREQIRLAVALARWPAGDARVDAARARVRLAGGEPGEAAPVSRPRGE